MKTSLGSAARLVLVALVVGLLATAALEGSAEPPAGTAGPGDPVTMAMVTGSEVLWWPLLPRVRHWREDAFGVVDACVFRSGLSLEEARRSGGIVVRPGRWVVTAANSGLHELLRGRRTFLGIDRSLAGARRHALAVCRTATFLGGCGVVRAASTEMHGENGRTPETSFSGLPPVPAADLPPAPAHRVALGTCGDGAEGSRRDRATGSST